MIIHQPNSHWQYFVVGLFIFLLSGQTTHSNLLGSRESHDTNNENLHNNLAIIATGDETIHVWAKPETKNLSFISHKRPIWWRWCGRPLFTKSWTLRETVAIESIKWLTLKILLYKWLIFPIIFHNRIATFFVGEKVKYITFALPPLYLFMWKHCTTNWLQDTTVEVRRRGREQNPHRDIALFLQEAGTSTSQFVLYWTHIDIGTDDTYIHISVCLLRSPSQLDVSWNLPRMPAARSRTVSWVSGSHERKTKQQKGQHCGDGRKIARETRDLSTSFLFLAQVNSNLSLCASSTRLLLATTLVVWILQA